MTSDRTMISLDNSPETVVSNVTGLPSIDIAEANIVNGTFWGASTVASSTAGALYWTLRTPNNTDKHYLEIQVDSEHPTTGGATIALYNGAPTITTTGTALTNINHNLADTANTTTFQIFGGAAYDSSVTSTNILETHALSANRMDVVIGNPRYELNVNSDYTLKYTGVASNTTVHLNFNWYKK